MKMLAEILRDADPLAYEPPRSPQERRARRQMILAASRASDHLPERRSALATIVAVAIAGIVLTAVPWSRPGVAVAAVRFEVRLAEETPTLGLRVATVAGTNRRIYLHSEPVIVNSDIAEAHVVQGESPSTFGVAITFHDDGAAKMRRATQSHVGRPLAILVDGEVVLAPVVRSPISASAIISGNYTRAEAERIAGGILGR